MSPAMPFDDYTSAHHVCREDNCPTADDSADVARWALEMLRKRPADEAAAPEYSLQLSKIISRDVSLASLIMSMLKVRHRHYIAHSASFIPHPARRDWCAGVRMASAQTCRRDAALCAGH